MGVPRCNDALRAARRIHATSARGKAKRRRGASAIVFAKGRNQSLRTSSPTMRRSPRAREKKWGRRREERSPFLARRNETARRWRRRRKNAATPERSRSPPRNTRERRGG